MVMLRRSSVAAAAGVLTMAALGCGSGEKQPAAQPVPEVTSFERGRFDDLPVFFRSDPLGPRSEKDGVVSYNQNLWIDHPFEGAAYLPR